MMYRVWYWLSEELHMVSCGTDTDYAMALLMYYHFTPSYHPWLESYRKEG